MDLIGENTAVMNNDSYSDKLWSILLQLGLPSCDLLHLGRKLGSKLLDLLEEQTREIQWMGQWADGVWDKAHSSKLPFGPMRKLAGYLNSSEFHFNTRTTAEPPECLWRLTPMSEWAQDAYAAVREEALCTGKHWTAVQVLHFFCQLNVVFLQDAAATLALYPERACHPVFELPVFLTADFKEYTTLMGQSLATENNPMDADLERVLPGVHRWHQANQSSINGMCNKVEGLITVVKESKQDITDLKEELQSQPQESEQRLANAFMTLTRELLSSRDNEKVGKSTSHNDFDEHLSLTKDWIFWWHHWNKKQYPLPPVKLQNIPIMQRTTWDHDMPAYPICGTNGMAKANFVIATVALRVGNLNIRASGGNTLTASTSVEQNIVSLESRCMPMPTKCQWNKHWPCCTICTWKSERVWPISPDISKWWGYLRRRNLEDENQQPAVRMTTLLMIKFSF